MHHYATTEINALERMIARTNDSSKIVAMMDAQDDRFQLIHLDNVSSWCYDECLRQGEEPDGDGAYARAWRRADEEAHDWRVYQLDCTMPSWLFEALKKELRNDH